MFTGFKGAAVRLDDIDLPRIGAEIGVGEDELHAFMDVETAGTGFDSRGRVKMLFEPHVFFRELGPGKKREAAVKKKLAYSKWDPKGYPADSYPRLVEAMAIDETAALRSASWGLGQIMGFNCRAAGYQTPQKMVQDFAADEENQLQAIVTFLKSKGLADELKRHDWAGIERAYNGGGFKGAYSEKMAAAFAKWQKKPDTPYSPGGVTIAEVTAAPATAPAAPASTTTADATGAATGTDPVHIEPASAPPPDPRLVIKQKPILQSRKIWLAITSAFASGPAWISGVFNGMDWKTLAVMAATFLALVLFFWFMYRKEISAGMLQADPPEGAQLTRGQWMRRRIRELMHAGKPQKEAEAIAREEAKLAPWEE